MNERVALYSKLPPTADSDWWFDHAAGSPDGRVLYLGCGAGRLALPLAEQAEIVAVDRDPEMLDAFRTRLRAVRPGHPVSLLRSNLEDLDLGERFGRVLLPSSLANEITDPTVRLGTLRAAAGHCRPDGAVLLHLLNPYWLTATDPGGTGTITPRGGGAPVEVTIAAGPLNPWAQRRTARMTYRFPDGTMLEDLMDAVALFPRDLERLTAAAGLEIVERHGTVPGRDPVDAAGPSWHLVCRPA